MKLKKSLALFVCLLMALAMLAGCNGKNEESSSSQSSSSQESASQGEESKSVEESAEPEVDLSQQEHVTLNIMMFGDGDSAEVDLVAEAVSEYLRPLINADVKITILGYSSYIQQVNLALSSGEALDAFPLLMMSLSTLVDNGSIIPIDDLFNEFGKDIAEVVSPEDLKTQMMHGELYGVPIQTDGAFSQGLYMRQNMLDEMEVDAASIKTMDDLYELLKRVKEEYPGVYPLVSNMGSLGLPFHVDYLGDISSPLGVLVDDGSGNLVVENLFENQSYVDHVKLMYKWTQEGLIMPEASSNTELDSALFKAGKGFATFRRLGEPKQLTGEISIMSGQPIAVQPLIQAYSTTDDIPSAWVIPTGSKNPERAMQFINLAYTDVQLANLLCHGIEGRHYEVVNTDTKQIDFPEGKTSATVGYPQKYWGWPNQTISYVFESQDPNIWDYRKEFVSTAVQSPAKGFVFDNSSVSAEITACKNVLAKYHNALLTGSINPDEALPKLNEELKSAGVETIISTKQAQLDAWAQG